LWPNRGRRFFLLSKHLHSWVDEEDKANTKYNTIRGKSKQNTGGNNNNNGNLGGRSNNYSGPNRKRKTDNTVAPPAPCERQLEEELRWLQRLAKREVPVASGRQPHH
jgi:hypothetical protein